MNMEGIMEESFHEADVEKGLCNKNVTFDADNNKENAAKKDSKRSVSRSRSNSPRSRSGSASSMKDTGPTADVKKSPKSSSRRIPLRTSPRTSPLMNNSRRPFSGEGNGEFQADSVTSLLEQRFNNSKIKNNSVNSPRTSRKIEKPQEALLLLERNSSKSAPSSPKHRTSSRENLTISRSNIYDISPGARRPRAFTDSGSLKIPNHRRGTHAQLDRRLSYCPGTGVSTRRDSVLVPDKYKDFGIFAERNSDRRRSLHFYKDVKQISKKLHEKRASKTSSSSSIDLEALEDLQRKAQRAKEIAPHMTPALSRPYRSHGAEILVAIMIIAVGGVALLVGKTKESGKTWTIAGIAMIGFGSVLLILGICWKCVSASNTAEAELQQKLIEATEILEIEDLEEKEKRKSQEKEDEDAKRKRRRKHRKKKEREKEKKEDKISIADSEVFEPTDGDKSDSSKKEENKTED